MYRDKLASIVGAAALICAASNAHALSTACTGFNGGLSSGGISGTFSGTGFAAGEVLRFTVTTPGTVLTIGLQSGGTTVVPQGSVSFSYSVKPADTAVLITLIGSFSPGTTVANWTCSAAVASGSPVSQTVNNAQAALVNGTQALQSFNDWVSKGVLSSFGLTGNGGTASAPPSRLARPTAQATVERLRGEERALREQLAEHPDGDAELARRLAATRIELTYARIAVNIDTAPTQWSMHAYPNSVPTSMPERERISLAESQQARESMSRPASSPAEQATRIVEGPIGSAPLPQSASPAISLGTRDLLDYCDADACDTLGKRWNVWLEGRVIGAVDSLSATNALGFVGSTGVDYKFLPWLAVGMSVGAETFETKLGTSGIRSGTLGFSAMPYVGVRLSDNIIASAFAGVSTIAYNTNPQPGVSANFNALRFLFGGALSGVWRDGPWRFQPTLSGTYGTEAQDGYTDSAGNIVPWQNVTYGRISAGPEIGRTFTMGDGSWSMEPFVLARANLDFASSNAVLLNGQSVVLRPGTLGSGSAGAGLAVRLESGISLRAQATYDSIGVSGLDIWTGLIRGGMAF